VTIPVAGKPVRTREGTTCVPLLENGDRLTRAEFERRYNAMPQVKKAELIEGVVYMPSPVRYTSHAKPHLWINTWLGTYCASTPGVEAADNVTLRLDWANEFQPDALLRLATEMGGHSRISADDYVEGPPELIVEVASSSVAYDLHAKLNVYCRNRVQEYLVWQIGDQRIDWFELHESAYVPLAPDKEWVLRSRVFPGLWLAADALLADDLAKVLAELQMGLQSQEHVAFVNRLERRDVC